MAWLIGDVQGCLIEAKALVNILPKETEEPIVFVGDLINRGPNSQGVLDWLNSLNRPAKCILGNHELGALSGIFNDDLASNRDLGWLKHMDTQSRHQYAETFLSWPLYLEGSGWLAVHAGIPPGWDNVRLIEACEEAQEALRMRPEKVFSSHEPEEDNVRNTLHLVTRLRFVDQQGKPNFSFKGTPEDAPRGLQPWYACRPPDLDKVVYFGHWAALGARTMSGYQSLDGGCVWGRELVAGCSKTKKLVRMPSTRPPREVRRSNRGEHA